MEWSALPNPLFQKVSHKNGENHVSPIIIYYQQTDIWLPKGPYIEGSGLNSCPSHNIVFLSRLFHSHKSSRIMCTIGGLGRHIGRQSTDISVDYRSTIGRQSTDYRLTVGRCIGRYVDRGHLNIVHMIRTLSTQEQDVKNRFWQTSRLNSLHTNIGMHFLHTVSYMFPKVLSRRISQTIQGFFSFRSFPLFPWP